MYQDKNGWTPLIHGLPEDGEECFVWYADPNGLDSWCFTKYNNESFDVSDVTHWRPIFKPPIKSRKVKGDKNSNG